MDDYGASCASKKSDFHAWGPLAWDRVRDGVRIVKLLEPSAAVSVPREIHGLPVVALGDGCFSGIQELKEVTLPDTLKKIGFMAFARCPRLEVLVLPDSVEELSPYMLRDSGVIWLKLSKAVKTLPNSVFSYCTGLRNVELQEGLRSIGCHAFYNTSVGCYGPLVIPESVEKIASGAFFSPLGPVKIKTSLPVDPFWFSEVPEPFSPVDQAQTTMMNATAGASVRQLWLGAVGELSGKAAQLRWDYHHGLLSREELGLQTEDSYWTVLQNFKDSLRALCRDKEIVWNENEFRYLNEVLLISCGMSYHLHESQGVTVGLLEDREANLMARMHQLAVGRE